MVYLGVDWGGTKIEAMALGEHGKTLTRHRVDTPRSDYEGCLKTIVELVDRVEAEVGPCDRVGVGLPGSLDPKTGIAKGASSTWMPAAPKISIARSMTWVAINGAATLIAAMSPRAALAPSWSMRHAHRYTSSRA